MKNNYFPKKSLHSHGYIIVFLDFVIQRIEEILLVRELLQVLHLPLEHLSGVCFLPWRKSHRFGRIGYPGKYSFVA